VLIKKGIVLSRYSVSVSSSSRMQATAARLKGFAASVRISPPSTTVPLYSPAMGETGHCKNLNAVTNEVIEARVSEAASITKPSRIIRPISNRS
jgi:hypothetical protein